MNIIIFLSSFALNYHLINFLIFVTLISPFPITVLNPEQLKSCSSVLVQFQIPINLHYFWIYLREEVFVQTSNEPFILTVLPLT